MKFSKTHISSSTQTEPQNRHGIPHLFGGGDTVMVTPEFLFSKPSVHKTIRTDTYVVSHTVKIPTSEAKKIRGARVYFSGQQERVHFHQQQTENGRRRPITIDKSDEDPEVRSARLRAEAAEAELKRLRRELK